MAGDKLIDALRRAHADRPEPSADDSGHCLRRGVRVGSGPCGVCAGLDDLRARVARALVVIRGLDHGGEAEIDCPLCGHCFGGHSCECSVAEWES